MSQGHWVWRRVQSGDDYSISGPAHLTDFAIWVMRHCTDALQFNLCSLIIYWGGHPVIVQLVWPSLSLLPHHPPPAPPSPHPHTSDLHSSQPRQRNLIRRIWDFRTWSKVPPTTRTKVIQFYPVVLCYESQPALEYIIYLLRRILLPLVIFTHLQFSFCFWWKDSYLGLSDG